MMMLTRKLLLLLVSCVGVVNAGDISIPLTIDIRSIYSSSVSDAGCDGATMDKVLDVLEECLNENYQGIINPGSDIAFTMRGIDEAMTVDLRGGADADAANDAANDRQRARRQLSTEERNLQATFDCGIRNGSNRCIPPRMCVMACGFGVESARRRELQERVIICHDPQDGTEKQTLSILQTSLSSHLDHGDLEGPCDGATEQDAIYVDVDVDVAYNQDGSITIISKEQAADGYTPAAGSGTVAVDVDGFVQLQPYATYCVRKYIEETGITCLGYRDKLLTKMDVYFA